MQPEEKARLIIDQKLIESGYVIQDIRDMNLLAAKGVIVREYPTDTGEVDYLIFINAQPVGIIEAKEINKGEKMVYSKWLPQFFISDIMDEDIVCPIGLEDKKLLLFDDFSCWDEGCYMGKVSKAVIEQMRKCN